MATQIQPGDTVILSQRKLGGYAPEHFRNVRRATVERVTATSFTAGGIRFKRTGIPYSRSDRHEWIDGFGHVWLEANTPELCTAKVWDLLGKLVAVPA